MRFVILAALVSLLFNNPALARDTKHMLSIEEAMSSEAYAGKLNPDIKFYFADQPHGKVVKSFGRFVSNKKTNAFGKSDQRACEWALLSALLSFQERVAAEGGNAVVDVISYYKKVPMSSKTQYECHAGGVMAGVALQGTVVKLQ